MTGRKVWKKKNTSNPWIHEIAHEFTCNFRISGVQGFFCLKFGQRVVRGIKILKGLHVKIFILIGWHVEKISNFYLLSLDWNSPGSSLFLGLTTSTWASSHINYQFRPRPWGYVSSVKQRTNLWAHKVFGHSKRVDSV